MADILYRKFALGLPFYRQALDYQMQGIDLIKQTIINWAGTLVPEICEEVYEFMTQLLVGYRYTQCDEIYIQVNKDGYGPGHKCFLWVHTSSSTCLSRYHCAGWEAIKISWLTWCPGQKPTGHMKRRNSSNASHCMDSCFQSQSVQGHPGKKTGTQECQRTMD